jgi:uncharacterized protein (TIGR02246 family)
LDIAKDDPSRLSAVHEPRRDDPAKPGTGDRTRARTSTARAFLAVLCLTATALFAWRWFRSRAKRRMAALDVRPAIDAGNAAYLDALLRGDAAAYAQLFTADAISMPANGAMVRGRDAIQASIAQAFGHVAFLDGALDTSELQVDGKTACESGRYWFDVMSEGKSMTLTGRYMVVWKKSGRGWKIAVDASQPHAAIAS